MGDAAGRRRSVRVAIVGASGIGRFHAQWWHAEGAEVVAFCGRTPESVAAAEAKLRALFPFAGRGYAALDEMLAREAPDIVDVCSPPALHHAHAKAALAAGAHVLCEKPYLFDPALPRAALLAQADELAALAAARGRRLGLCVQYTVAAAECARLLAAAGGAAAPRRIEAELRSPARGRPPDPGETWIDLGPHLVSAAQALWPAAAWDDGPERVRAAPFEAEAAFALRLPDGSRAAARLTTGRTFGEPAHVRRLTLDGVAFDLAGEKGPDGLFGLRYRSTAAEAARPDTMRLAIRGFLDGSSFFGPAAARTNLDVCLRVRERLGSAPPG